MSELSDTIFENTVALEAEIDDLKSENNLLKNKLKMYQFLLKKAESALSFYAQDCNYILSLYYKKIENEYGRKAKSFLNMLKEFKT